MKTHSIISNTISEEILQSGHLSIRLLGDGFSLLLEDKNYKPVVLIQAGAEQAVSLPACISACEEWLNRHTLLENFKGECSIIPGSLSETIVPEELFTPENKAHYISGVSAINATDTLFDKHITGRPFVIVYAVRNIVRRLAGQFSGNTRIISDTEVMLSLADQVNASDHQRGFAFLEVQQKSMRILLIKNDEVQIINQLEMPEPDSLVYHTLNVLKQLNFDLKQAPFFYAGKLPEESYAVLKKYIRNIHALGYVIQDIDKDAILENALLAEASKCV